jgi:hypothetical protein
MRRLIMATALAWTAVAGCTDWGKDGSGRAKAALTPDGYSGPVVAIDAIPGTGKLPTGCVRIEGDALGQNVTLTILGQRTITFTGWTLKTGTTDEYVRFSFEASGPVAYTVKAGTQTFSNSVLLWAHPGGLSAAKGISNIAFCAAPPGTGGAAPADPQDPTPTIESTNPPSEGYGGAACTSHLECWSGECLNDVCSQGWSFDRCVDGERDCISGECTVLGCAPIPNGERGAPCEMSLNCWSGACVNHVCQGGDLGDACRSTDDCKIGYDCGSGGACQVGFAN